MRLPLEVRSLMLCKTFFQQFSSPFRVFSLESSWAEAEEDVAPHKGRQ